MFGVFLRKFLAFVFIVVIVLASLVFEILDFLFLLRQLASNFLDLVFEFLFQLDDSFLPLLQVSRHFSQLGVDLLQLLTREAEVAIPNGFFVSPLASHVLNRIEFSLLQMGEELRHFSSLPHL